MPPKTKKTYSKKTRKTQTSEHGLMLLLPKPLSHIGNELGGTTEPAGPLPRHSPRLHPPNSPRQTMPSIAAYAEG